MIGPKTFAKSCVAALGLLAPALLWAAEPVSAPASDAAAVSAPAAEAGPGFEGLELEGLMPALEPSGDGPVIHRGRPAPNLLSPVRPAGSTVVPFPYNMARSKMGTKIQVQGTEGTPFYAVDITAEVEDVNSSEHALLSDDMTLSYPLQKDAISLVFSFAYSAPITWFNFFNFGGEGEVRLYASTERPDSKGNAPWQQVGLEIPFSVQGVHGMTFPEVNARYWKAEFKQLNGSTGRVGGFGLFGDLRRSRVNQITNFRTLGQDMPLFRIVHHNLASSFNGADVLYSSSSTNPVDLRYDQQRLQIDDNSETFHEFAPDDPNPTVVVDLGDTRPLKRISWLFETVPGRFDFYLSHQLPKEHFDLMEDNKGRRWVARVDEKFFKDTPPFHTSRNRAEKGGRQAFNFDDISARYIVYRFTPDPEYAELAPVASMRINEFHAFGRADPLNEPYPDINESDEFPDVNPVSK